MVLPHAKWVLALLGAVLLYALVVWLSSFAQGAFWPGYLGNLLATLAGVAAACRPASRSTVGWRRRGSGRRAPCRPPAGRDS